MENELLYYDDDEKWSHALLLYDAVLKEICTKLEILNNEFKLAHQYNPIEHITSRIKSASSIARKIRLKQKELTVENIIRYVNDVAGVRIICSFTSDIYRIAAAISNQNDVTVLKVKDYIAHPKANGYMSYPMIVSIPIFLSDDMIDTKVEIQIRTIAMDFWASLEHKIYYKFEGKAPEGIRDELKECAQIISFLDQKMLSPEEAVGKLQEQAELLDFEGESHVTVTEITLEYVVVISTDGQILVTPFWRLLLGENEDERNFLHQNILGINAVTGELIWEERGNTL